MQLSLVTVDIDVGEKVNLGKCEITKATRTCLGPIVGPVDAQVQAVSFARQPEKSWVFLAPWNKPACLLLFKNTENHHNTQL